MSGARVSSPARGVAWAVLGLALLGLATGAAATEPPRLVLLLVVDQLPTYRLDAGLTGGLGRLARQGRLFTDGRHDHAHTETCPGHAVLLSGVHPGRGGVPGNQFVDRETGKKVYCIAGESDDAQVHGGSARRSPRLLEYTALGDWLKDAHPEARVFSVSAKDRAAVTLGGQHPDAAYWLDTREALGFTSSRYYVEALPEWVRSFNGEGTAAPEYLAALPERWEHPSGSPPNGARRDDFESESSRYKRTTPHPLAHSGRGEALRRLLVTPHLDDVTLDFARALIESEDLGSDAVPDLLALSLSATDFIGHYYGPDSQEAREALLHLDRSLGVFLAELDVRFGEGGVVIAFSSDHGVMPLPEWLAESGRSVCPVPGGRVHMKAAFEALESHLRQSLETPGTRPGSWVTHAGLQLSVSRARAEEVGIPVERAIAAARVFVANLPGVARVWSAGEIQRTDHPLGRLYRNSYSPERSGDLEIQPEPTCLLTFYEEGTNHGTPYDYDRAVPILFHGPDIEPGSVRGPARTIDIAPTLARLLGLTPPADLDGRPLPLR